ncbi:uncharacterized protein B0I36DRAFT_92820 [Microdochium trichocladiopsis]|uniref:Uncharacterized protein n=1 Tax=Microdochium trichocladiopsis TaxID=1682393 RepID=A0A9P8YBI6_9PEZI|nr:uncharacterized protein B0I36DRAFT_92820 [Microdochium trichocladiopsis]KAH7035453.1 hypothetical protein B0I36DRAFT_92820 [Microdochium trichocladiopsis]
MLFLLCYICSRPPPLQELGCGVVSLYFALLRPFASTFLGPGLQQQHHHHHQHERTLVSFSVLGEGTDNLLCVCVCVCRLSFPTSLCFSSPGNSPRPVGWGHHFLCGLLELPPSFFFFSFFSFFASRFLLFPYLPFPSPVSQPATESLPHPSPPHTHGHVLALALASWLWLCLRLRFDISKQTLMRGGQLS